MAGCFEVEGPTRIEYQLLFEFSNCFDSAPRRESKKKKALSGFQCYTHIYTGILKMTYWNWGSLGISWYNVFTWCHVDNFYSPNLKGIKDVPYNKFWMLIICQNSGAVCHCTYMYMQGLIQRGGYPRIPPLPLKIILYYINIPNPL